MDKLDAILSCFLLLFSLTLGTDSLPIPKPTHGADLNGDMHRKPGVDGGRGPHRNHNECNDPGARCHPTVGHGNTRGAGSGPDCENGSGGSRCRRNNGGGGHASGRDCENGNKGPGCRRNDRAPGRAPDCDNGEKGPECRISNGGHERNPDCKNGNCHKNDGEGRDTTDCENERCRRNNEGDSRGRSHGHGGPELPGHKHTSTCGCK